MSISQNCFRMKLTFFNYIFKLASKLYYQLYFYFQIHFVHLLSFQFFNYIICFIPNFLIYFIMNYSFSDLIILLIFFFFNEFNNTLKFFKFYFKIFQENPFQESLKFLIIFGVIIHLFMKLFLSYFTQLYFNCKYYLDYKKILIFYFLRFIFPLQLVVQ